MADEPLSIIRCREDIGTILTVDPPLRCDLPEGHPLPHRSRGFEWVSTRDG